MLAQRLGRADSLNEELGILPTVQEDLCIADA